jgi:signal transduction histidine kinase
MHVFRHQCRVRLTHSARKLNGRGLGFDVETSSQQDWEFISMCERIEPIGGEFESWSGPGQGTRITASAPIVKQALNLSPPG